MNYITAYLHGKTYYLPQDGVLQIEHRAVVTKVPSSPDWVVGLTPYRGEPIPVIDAFEPDAAATALQILYAAKDGIAAYQVDTVGDFCEMTEAETMPFSEENRFLSPIKILKTETERPYA